LLDTLTFRGAGIALFNRFATARFRALAEAGNLIGTLLDLAFFNVR
jgi:hypothetical protein